MAIACDTWGFGYNSYGGGLCKHLYSINAVAINGLFTLGRNHCLFFQSSVGASVVSIPRGI
jgi:hypothetical protein